jgi:hypothetical protein
MQTQAWTLQTVRDGQTRENLSQEEAAQAIRRAMRGQNPLVSEPRSISRQQSHSDDVRVAA